MREVRSERAAGVWALEPGRVDVPVPISAFGAGRPADAAVIHPGKPVENCFVESFNGEFRDECLSAHRFTDLRDARFKIETWRQDFNYVRPHQSLNNVPPKEYATLQELQPPPAAYAPAADIICEPPGLS